MTQDYYGTKRVTAWKEPGRNGEPGYAVKYRDSYRSWSPKDVFEAHYQPLNALSFGHALEVLKAGGRVARTGWNGQGMYLALVRESGYGITKPPYKEPHLIHGAYIGIKTADNKFVPWLASQTDVLADDWVVVE